MSNEDRKTARRKEFLPTLAQTFAKHGYRKATTALLATKCKVSEVILYRLWNGGKKAMFVDSINYLYEKRVEQWNAAIKDATSAEARIDALIKETRRNLGQNKLYRIIFVALTETDEDEVKQALKRMYLDFHQRLQNELATFRQQTMDRNYLPIDETAWTLVAWGAFMNIVMELELFGEDEENEMQIDDLFPKVAEAIIHLKSS